MNGDEVDDVGGDAAVGGGGGFVGGEVGRVEDVAEEVVGLGWEEAEGGDF